CHGNEGAGLSVRGEVVFPQVWGDNSYNWGAGISRVFTLASFIKHNMPLGQPNSLTDQQAWDLAQFIDSQERPQDPRYTGDVKETLELYRDTFHKHTMYGQEVNGRVLGDHDNVGRKDFLRPGVRRGRACGCPPSAKRDGCRPASFVVWPPSRLQFRLIEQVQHCPRASSEGVDIVVWLSM